MKKAETLLGILSEMDVTTRNNVGEPDTSGTKLKYVDIAYCPECKKEIEIKKNDEKIICPDCGCEITLKDVDNLEPKSKDESKSSTSITNSIDKIEGNTSTNDSDKDVLVDYLSTKFNNDYSVEMSSNINEGIETISFNITPNISNIDEIKDDIVEILDVSEKDLEISESKISYVKIKEE